MNKLKAIIILFVGLLGMASCSETDNSNEEYSNWQSRNAEYFAKKYQQAIDSITAGNDNWKIIKNYSYNDKVTSPDQYSKVEKTEYIVVHVLKHADAKNTESPMIGDTVRVHYYGTLMPTVQHPEGVRFDSSWLGEYDSSTARPKDFAITTSLRDGFATAVLNMHVGDRWLVYMPQELGYKGTEQTSIPAYSTLTFDITLVAFGKRGTKMPTFH